ncbi:M23 family metallopeptidase [Streptomyces sp. NPDC048718]|uniref:M23 family metallopeptidase n=1 Tax=Streptomyces sp. NPDC048718 TaxID=3365587 RepID=UPI00371E64F1
MSDRFENAPGARATGGTPALTRAAGGLGGIVGRLPVPGFAEEPADGCDCPGCTAFRVATRAARGSGAGALRGIRRAVVAALGAVALAGTCTGTAAAEPAPSHAGWDGSRYWFKNAAGEWRWTRHHDTYARDGGGAAHTAASLTVRPSRAKAEPVFRGRQGWDAKDRVYWFKSGGHWYWTGHQAKYEQRTGLKAGGSSASGHGSGSGSGSGTGHGSGSGSGHGSGGGAAAGRGWTRPVSGYVFTGTYGERGTWSLGYHTGQDFAVPTGTTVRAVGPGRVVRTGYDRSYGYEVVIRHSDGRYTQYAHLSRIDVPAGRSVSGGQHIGRSGATGRVTGPHLHFEVRTTPYFGSHVDPLAYLRGHGVRV